ncbi:PilN domain-containing protein [Thermodesulfobacteriota bacterium]
MVRINLLPIRDTLRKRELKNFGIVAAVMVAVAIAIVLGLWWYLSMQIEKLGEAKRVQEQSLTKLKKENEEIAKLNEEIKRLQRQVDTIKKLTSVRDTPAPFMKAVSMSIPPEVWITSLTKSGSSFTIDGVGVDNTVVVNFVQNLQAIRKDFSVKRPKVDPTVKTDTPFFGRVKLTQVVRSAGRGGLGSMKFRIVGSIRN